MSLIYIPNTRPAVRERWKFIGRETHWGFTFLIWELVANPSPRNHIGHALRHAAGDSVTRQATITIPAPCQFINSNQRLHRMAQAKLTRAWRQASAAAAHGLPPFTGQVHITAHIFKPRAGRYDTNNLAPTTKAIVDGLVDAGLLVDDSTAYVIGPDHRHGGKGPAEIILDITETGAQP